jgi:uncharacterized protein (TIRG00374 family)
LLLGVFLFVALVERTGAREILEALAHFGLGPFVLFVLISLLNFGLFVYRWQKILRSQDPGGRRLSWFRLYLHRMSGYAVSYLTPAAYVGGEPVRVGLLVADGVEAKRATSSVVIDVAFDVSALIIFIAAGLFFAVFEGIELGHAGGWFIAGLVFFALILLSFYLATVSGRGFFWTLFCALGLHRLERLKGAGAWIRGVDETLAQAFRQRTRMLAWLLALSLVMVSFRVFEQWFIAHYLGIELSFSQAFLTATIPGLAFLIPVPSALGFFEASQKGLFALLGVPINVLALTLIIRFRDMIFIAIGMLHGFRRVFDYLTIQKPKPVV